MAIGSQVGKEDVYILLHWFFFEAIACFLCPKAHIPAANPAVFGARVGADSGGYCDWQGTPGKKPSSLKIGNWLLSALHPLGFLKP